MLDHVSKAAEPTILRARDGFPLAATFALPAGEPWGAALVAPAMGVPRRHYAPLQAFFAREGLASLALDYRGIGGSAPPRLRGFRATLHDWAELDLAAALEALRARFSRLPLAYVGHSVGGQIFGLLPQPDVRAALFFASQSGHPRHWRGARRLLLASLWNGLLPLLAGALGYLPMRAFGQGEDLPAGVAREWARWGRRRDYVLSYARPRGGLGFARWDGRLCAYGFTDDGYAPEAAVRALVAMYERAQSELRIVSPRELGVPAIGHFGWLRPSFEAPLWAPALAFLRDALRP